MNLFKNQKEMKKWCIDMGNAVGGQMLEKTNLVKPANPTKVVELTLQFVADYNEEILKAQEEYKRRRQDDDKGKEEE
tara:strand:+ start:3099 stop:3329 length:231 start_codon:yes stop_codon:yes gene_type:complete